jgi:hypothetical protein
MQKKQSPKIRNFQRFLEIANKYRTWLPVSRNGWWLKFSTYNNDNILLIVVSQHTGQTVIRYFNHENQAVEFINYICECDPYIKAMCNN